MAFKITGDGTSQTVTVHFTHSATNNLQDDEIWLEVMYPSEGGTTQYDYKTTKLILKGTAADVTTETETWGGSTTKDQKLTVSISPDYVGRAYCRVVVATGPNRYDLYRSSPGGVLMADPFVIH